MFDKASRMKLRFETTKGLLAVEDLWDLPLSSTTGKPNLDSIAVELHKQLKNSDTVSFVAPAKTADETLQLKFDIVKHIIEIKVAENTAASEARVKKEKKQQLLNIIEQKENEQLASASVEELKKMLETL